MGLQKGARLKSVGGRARAGITRGRATGSDRTPRSGTSKNLSAVAGTVRSTGRQSAPSFRNFFAR